MIIDNQCVLSGSTFLGGDGEHPPLLILGTCIAEHLARIAKNFNDNTDHYLYESLLNSELQSIDYCKYSGIVFHITLRHLLWIASDGIGGDVSYITNDENDFFSLTKDASEYALKVVSDLCVKISPHTPIPVFCLAIIEPPITTRGIFQNNRGVSIYRLVREINDQLASGISEISGCYFIETNDVARYFGDGNSYDGYHSFFTHAGIFSDAFLSSLLTRIYNSLRIIKGSDQVKLIITDLDNTLWNGIAAEEDEIVQWQFAEGWPLGYVEALLECKRRGIMLAICSKNDEISTVENFAKIWHPRISLDDFVIRKINWESKSRNISEILHETNILPSNALFIDDNKMEIDEVQSLFPDLRALTYPAENWKNILLYSAQTQTAVQTEEGLAKTDLMQAKVARDISARGANRIEWLENLGLTVKFSQIKDSFDKHFDRAIELLNKTNQFNTTGKRWGVSEVEEFFDKGGTIFAAFAQDKFTNNGLICEALVSGNSIVQVVLSCRVFSLGIEVCLLSHVMERIFKSHGSALGYFSDTGKNATCSMFFNDNGFVEVGSGILEGTEIPTHPHWIEIIE